MNPNAVLTRPVDVAHLPKDAVEIVAGEAERAKLAAEYDLLAVNSLMATATLTPGPRGAVEVEGRVVADIEQTCVVSLVPVAQHIDEPFSFRFVRPTEAPPPPKPGAEVIIDPERPDPPEILEGPVLDVGAIAEEAFALAIDPYPRAPGAVLPAEVRSPADAASDSPFAALARLSRTTGEGG